MITTAADNTRLAGFSTLLALLFSLAVCLSVDTALAISEVYSDLQIRRDRAIHPWVRKDLFDCRPLRRFQGHHPLEEIFELRRVQIAAVFSLCMGSPE